MKRTLVKTADCSKCMMIVPFAQKKAEEKGIDFEVKLFDEYEDKDAIITVPTLVVEDESKKYLTDEELINFLQS